MVRMLMLKIIAYTKDSCLHSECETVLLVFGCSPTLTSSTASTPTCPILPDHCIYSGEKRGIMKHDTDRELSHWTEFPLFMHRKKKKGF